MTLKHNRWKGFVPPTPEEIAANPDAYYVAEGHAIPDLAVKSSLPPCKVTPIGDAIYRKMVEQAPELCYHEWTVRCGIEAACRASTEQELEKIFEKVNQQ